MASQDFVLLNNEDVPVCEPCTNWLKLDKHRKEIAIQQYFQSLLDSQQAHSGGCSIPWHASRDGLGAIPVVYTTN